MEKQLIINLCITGTLFWLMCKMILFVQDMEVKTYEYSDYMIGNMFFAETIPLFVTTELSKKNKRKMAREFEQMVNKQLLESQIHEKARIKSVDCLYKGLR